MKKLLKNFSDQNLALGSPVFYILLLILTTLLAIAFIKDYPEYVRLWNWD